MEDSYRLIRGTRDLAPSVAFASRAGEWSESYWQEPNDVGVVDCHRLVLGTGLSYHRTICTASGDATVLGLRVEGDPYKLGFNLSDQALPCYIEGLEVSPWLPGSVYFYPIRTAAALVPHGARATLSFLLVSRDFMREIVAGTGLPDELRPASKPPNHEPWVLYTKPPAAAVQAVAMIDGCPLVGPLRRLYVEAKALEVIALLLSRMYAIKEPTDARLRPREVRKAYEARDIVDSRLDDLPSLTNLARAVGMSTTALKRVYRRTFGLPIYEYARNERLQRARALLAEGEFSVAEVAARAGFQSLSWFSLAFKRRFGVLPREVWSRAVKELSSRDNAAP
jgi:AraC-like DNA-binding protein